MSSMNTTKSAAKCLLFAALTAFLSGALGARAVSLRPDSNSDRSSDAGSDDSRASTVSLQSLAADADGGMCFFGFAQNDEAGRVRAAKDGVTAAARAAGLAGRWNCGLDFTPRRGGDPTSVDLPSNTHGLHYSAFERPAAGEVPHATLNLTCHPAQEDGRSKVNAKFYLVPERERESATAKKGGAKKFIGAKAKTKAKTQPEAGWVLAYAGTTPKDQVDFAAFDEAHNEDLFKWWASLSGGTSGLHGFARDMGSLLRSFKDAMDAAAAGVDVDLRSPDVTCLLLRAHELENAPLLAPLSEHSARALGEVRDAAVALFKAAGGARAMAARALAGLAARSDKEMEKMKPEHKRVRAAVRAAAKSLREGEAWFAFSEAAFTAEEAEAVLRLTDNHAPMADETGKVVVF